MKIAQVAPLAESVPPKLYGGTERVVAYLADELVRQGHDVTLFASGDSHTCATLVPVCDRALRLSTEPRDSLALHFLMVEQVAQLARQFDVVHFHIAPLHFPVARRMETAHISTLHGRLDLPDLVALYREFSDMGVVSISDAQRTPLMCARWLGTVYHGVPESALQFHETPGSYFGFLGRISPEKRVDRAIAIATACGCPLRIAAKVDAVDAAYFEREIQPLLDHPLITYMGEIGHDDKSDFLGQAKALLFPIDWPEPFGLVMIEALACGTPVVAFRGGSVEEIIEDGVTGFIVDSVEDAVAAAHKVDTLDRRACRASFDQRFSAARMAADYLELYTAAIDRNRMRIDDGQRLLAAS
jgi:glycosyltransferase involved in cell wall biosynthesis